MPPTENFQEALFRPGVRAVGGAWPQWMNRLVRWASPWRQLGACSPAGVALCTGRGLCSLSGTF